MSNSHADLGPAEGELRIMLDLALARGWNVIWQPVMYQPATGRGIKPVPRNVAHYLVKYLPDRARMIGVNAAGARELLLLLQEGPTDNGSTTTALGDVLALSLRKYGDPL